MKEVDVTEEFAAMQVAPRIEKAYTRGSWLADTQKRVATLQVQYTEDLIDALSHPQKGKISLASSKRFGTDVGRLLVPRLCQLGAACTLHGDLKPENVLLLMPPFEGQVTLTEVKIIDFDPGFMFVGCDCVKLPMDMRVALFAILNLMLFWAWFEQDKATNRHRGSASDACHRVLAGALDRSAFPLDEVAPRLPRELTARLQKWWANNYKNRPFALFQLAYSRFPNLRAERHRSGLGVPLVDGMRVSAASFARGDIEGARARLTRIAESIKGMACGSS
jgi:hypothetical protein